MFDFRLPRRFNSLRIQLIIWIALPVAVSLLGMSMVEIRGHEQTMTRMVQQQAELVARSLGVLIDGHVDQRQGLLLQLASEHLSNTTVLAAPPAVFAAGVTVLSPSGAALTETEQLSPWATNTAVTALVVEVSTGQKPGLATIYDETLKQWLLVQAVPISANSATPSLVLVGAEPVAALITNHLIASLDPTLIDEMRLTTATGDRLYSQTAAQGSVSSLPTNPSHPGHGAARLVTGQTTIVTTGWQVTVSKDWRDLVPPVLTFGNVALLILGVAVVLSLLSAYFGLRSIVWPLQRLNHVVGQVGWGNFTAVQKPVGGVAEIEELRLALARMAEQIRQYQQELQSYIGAMTLGQEEERRRLSRELHDATVQDLIALSQQVEMAERELTRNPQRAATRLHELRPMVTAIIDGLRRQIHAFRPLYLEDLGFVPAIEMLVREASKRHQLSSDFLVTGNAETQLAPAIEVSAFRIAQEALQNVLKHAHATHVHLILDFAGDYLTLRVVDDGQGFVAPNQPYHLAQQGHFGVLGMKERAQLHGGTLQIESKPGQGTTVTVRLPRYELSALTIIHK